MNYVGRGLPLLTKFANLAGWEWAFSLYWVVSSSY